MAEAVQGLDDGAGQQHRPSPQSLANLRPPWKPGTSGNPGGRPPGASLRTPALRLLAAEPNEHGEGKRAVEAAQRLVDIATGIVSDPDPSEVKALTELADWADGKLVQERVNTNIELVEGITLRDRRRDAPPVPGAVSEEKKS